MAFQVTCPYPPIAELSQCVEKLLKERKKKESVVRREPHLFFFPGLYFHQQTREFHFFLFRSGIAREKSGPPAGAKKSLKTTQRTTRAREFLDPKKRKTTYIIFHDEFREYEKVNFVDVNELTHGNESTLEK